MATDLPSAERVATKSTEPPWRKLKPWQLIGIAIAALLLVALVWVPMTAQTCIDRRIALKQEAINQFQSGLAAGYPDTYGFERIARKEAAAGGCPAGGTYTWDNVDYYVCSVHGKLPREDR